MFNTDAVFLQNIFDVEFAGIELSLDHIHRVLSITKLSVYVFMYMVYVYVCVFIRVCGMCLHVYSCRCSCISMCTCMWRTEDSLMSHLQEL